MGEGEQPEGLPPEEIAARLTVSPEVEVDEPTREARARGLLESSDETLERMEEQSYVGSVDGALHLLESLAEEEHLKGSLPPGHPEASRPVEVPVQSDESQTEIPVEHPVDAEEPKRFSEAEAKMRREQRDVVIATMQECVQRYNQAYIETKTEVAAHAGDAVSERDWHILNLRHSKLFMDLSREVHNDGITDPSIIRSKFDTAIEELHAFRNEHGIPD